MLFFGRIFMQTIEETRFVTSEDHELHYRVFGSGKEPFLYFHGFGQSKEEFSPPEEWYDRFRFYSFDLFYHGNSTGDHLPLTGKKWREIFLAFVRAEGLVPGTLTIAGYSMGGRFVLSIAAFLPEYIRRVILVAPDGIYRSPFYRLANFARPIFRELMTHPRRFDRLVDLAEKSSIVSPSLVKFSRRELGPLDNRMRVYYCWTLFRTLGIPRSTVIKKLHSQGIQGSLYLGKKDYVIPVSKVLPTFENLPMIKTHVMPLRHHELVDAAWRHLDGEGEL